MFLKKLYILIAKLPNTWAQRLGVALGTLMFWLPNREKRVATINIGICFPELSAREQRQLVKKTLIENAKMLFELPRIFQQGGTFATGLIREVKGIEHFQEALKQNKGVILLAPHLGNWEIVVHYLSQFANITAMYDRPKQDFLDEMIKKARQSSGATLVPADGKGVRAQLKTLKQGGVIGILPDQAPWYQSANVYAPFMGHTAFTMLLVNNLAKRTNAAMLMTFAERLGVGEGYRLHVLPAPIAIATDDPVEAGTALNQAVEMCVRLAPTQYQWTYKRFKRPPKGQKSPYNK